VQIGKLFLSGENNMKPVGDFLRPIGNDTDFTLDLDDPVSLGSRWTRDGGLFEPQSVASLSSVGW
jgi:hypothetical protein